MTKKPSKSKTEKPSDLKGTTAPSTTGPQTPRDLNSIFPMLPADHRLFQGGYKIGERRSTPLSKRSQATKEPKPKNK